MKYYILIVTSNLFIKHYNIKAYNLQDAIKRAKVKFAKQFKIFDVKVQLEADDLKNHINEILEYIYNK